MQLAKNVTTNSNSKHFDVRHHFMRKLAVRKEIAVIHVPSAQQHAESLTKTFGCGVLCEFYRNYVMNLKRWRCSGISSHGGLLFVWFLFVFELSERSHTSKYWIMVLGQNIGAY